MQLLGSSLHCTGWTLGPGHRGGSYAETGPAVPSLPPLPPVVVQLLRHVWLFATLWTAAHEAPMSFTISWSLLRLMCIELGMPSNHLILFLRLPDQGQQPPTQKHPLDHKSTPCPRGGRATLEIWLQPPTYTSAVIFELLHQIWKKDKGRSTWFRRILSGSAGGQCAVTLLVFCLSPQRVLGEDALCRCFSELGSLGARPSWRVWGGAPLFDSQFKGTSSPRSSPAPCGASLKETVTVFRSLIFFPQRL